MLGKIEQSEAMTMQEVALAKTIVILPLQLIAKINNNAIRIQVNVQPIIISAYLQARLICCE